MKGKREMKLKKLLSIILSALCLAGCSGNESGSETADEPANFFHTVMETENGYYYYDNYPMALKFYDKATQTEVYLCNKPECLHDGNSFCAATANNLSIADSVLYNNAIYLLAFEGETENAAVCVYKAELDGSSLTRLYEIADLKKSAEQYYQLSDGNMIIHNGKLYLTYKLSTDTGSFGFGKAQFCEVDLKNGKIKVLHEVSDNFSPLPGYFCGIGDSIYYSIYADKKSVNYRYDQKTGKTSAMDTDFSNLRSDGESLYGFKRIDEVNTFCRYDLETKEITHLLSGMNSFYNEVVMISDDLMFIYERGEEYDVVLGVYDMSGNKLTTVYPSDVDEYTMYFSMTSSDGWLYLNTFVTHSFESSSFVEFSYDAVYKCSIEDLKNGKKNFVLAYKTNEYYYDEQAGDENA